MVEYNPIKKLVRGYSEIKIGGETLKVKPTPRDAEAILIITSSKKMSEQEAAKLTGVMKTMIKRANPDATDQELDEIIATNYGQILEELVIMFGFATRKQLEELSKKRVAGPLEE